jgi:hypothetical protein
MVVLAGDTALNDSDGVQQFDQARFAAATEAGFVPIWKASEAEEAVQTAFHRARVESRPIVLYTERSGALRSAVGGMLHPGIANGDC